MPPDRSLLPLPAKKPTSRMISASGRLHNDHFHLVADHLMLEVECGTFELVAAFAEGSVEVHLQREDLGLEYTFFGRRAVFRAEQGRLHLGDWLGSRQNSEVEVFEKPRQELILPADGSFFAEAALPGPGPLSPSVGLCLEVLTTA